jgi:hypothetical protein
MSRSTLTSTLAAELLEREACGEAIAGVLGHGDLGPGLGPLVAVSDHACHFVVSVGDQIRAHHHLVADDAFDGKKAAVDLGPHALDAHPLVARRQGGVVLGLVGHPGVAVSALDAVLPQARAQAYILVLARRTKLSRRTV